MDEDHMELTRQLKSIQSLLLMLFCYADMRFEVRVNSARLISLFASITKMCCCYRKLGALYYHVSVVVLSVESKQDTLASK